MQLSNCLRTSILLPLVLLILVSGCVIQQNPVSGNKRLFGWSWEREVQLGREADEQFVAQFGLYEEDEVAEYVRQIGEDMLSVSHMRREDTPNRFRETEFTFRLLDSPVINAFALPGGYVYVTRGLMAHMNNEAQFAVVMGHEIGHVAARHASQRAIRQTIGQIAVIGGAVIGQEVLGLPGGDLLQVSGMAMELLFLSYSRENERESDRLGVEYAAMRNYRAAEGAAFFTSLKRISERHGQVIPNLLSSHPDPGEREQEIPRQAAEWESAGHSQDRLEEERWLNMISGMIYGENPRDGFERDGWFNHPNLKFRYAIPDRWSLINQPDQVILVNEEQSAISRLSMDPEAESPEQSIQEITASEEITIVEEGSVNRDGWGAAWETVARARTEDGSPLGLHLFALEFDGRIYRFLNYSVEEEFDEKLPEFRQLVRSFERLEDPVLLTIEPVRIAVTEISRAGQLSEFLPDPIPMGIEPLEIAIMNQVELDEELPAGRLLKIPVQP
ncbi:MAG: M48 family metalloprotease [Balneolaceae bacterium]